MADPKQPAPELTRVNLVDADGAVVNADAADLDVLIGDGYRVAEPEEVQRDFDRQQYGEGFGNELQTFGESTASGATLGLSDVAAKSLAPEYAAELAKRREYNPTADLAGQGVGLVGSTLLTGGESLLAKGALAATAPARGLMALGTAATKGAAKLAGKEAATSVLGRAAATGASYAAGGAVEGALFGAAKVATDDYLTDHEITAERIVAGAGNGALWGGALGGGLGFAGGLAVGGARKLGSLFDGGAKGELAAVRDLERVTADAESRAAADAVSGSRAEVGLQTGARAELDASVDQSLAYRSDEQITAEIASAPSSVERQGAIATLQAMGDEAQAAKRFAKLQQESTTDFTARGNRVSQTADDLQEVANVGLKPDMFEALMKADPPKYEAVESTTDGLLNEIQGVLSRADGDSRLYTPAGLNGLNRANSAIDDFRNAVFERATKEALDTPAAAARYMTDVDVLKRTLGRVQGGIRGDANAKAIVKDAYHQLMRHAEDANVFGNASVKAQREINAAYTRYLDYADSLSADFGLTNSVTRSTRDGFEKVPMLDPAKVGNMANNLGRAENAQKEAVWAIGLERKADLLDTLAKWYDVPEGMKAAVASAREDTRAMVQGMRELRALNETADAYREQLQSVRDLPVVGETLAKLKINLGKTISLAGKSEARAATQAEAAATSLTRSDSRAAVRAAAGSGATAYEQSALRHATNGERAVEGAARGVMQWMKDAGTSAARTTAKAARATAETIAQAGPLMGVEMALRKPETYERVIRNVGALRDPQSDERKVIRARMVGLRQSNPDLAQALEAHTQRTADFLAAKAGELYSTPKAGDPFGGKRKPRHDPAKAAKLARYIDAAQNPQHALTRIAGGDIKREDIETLKALYPRIYQRVVSEVLGKLGEVETMPPYQARLKLGHLLDAPADPSMRPENVAWLQGVAASKAQENAAAEDGGTLAPSRRREPRISNMYATRSQDLAGMGANK